MDPKQMVEYIERLEQALALKELIIGGLEDQVEFLRTRLALHESEYET
jgi:hypothetical protein